MHQISVLWDPVESDSLTPLRRPRVSMRNDHQHHESIVTVGIRTTTEKEHNLQRNPNAVEAVVPDLQPSLMLTEQIADQKTKPEMSINIIYETAALERTLAEQPLFGSALAEMAQAQPTETRRKQEVSKGPQIVARRQLTNEGFDVATGEPPKPKEASTSIAKGVTNCPKIPRKICDLPPDAAHQDPSALLAYMRPQTRYQDLGCHHDTRSRGDARIFAASITVDGTVFEGQAWSKKLARKVAAARACRELFGVVSDTIYDRR